MKSESGMGDGGLHLPTEVVGHAPCGSKMWLAALYMILSTGCLLDRDTAIRAVACCLPFKNAL